MRFTPQFLDELRARLPVSEVVGKRVKLRKAGREWRGLSPFNKERSPSFFVNDQKGFYHDFSSGKHGDIFTFVIETEGVTFAEAVERLAALAGMLVPVVSEDASIGQITNAARPEGNFPHARPFPHTRIEDFWFEWTTSKAEIGQIKAGQKHLYIWGFLQYRSIASDEPRVSRFCFHYFHRRNSRGSFDEGWTMEPPEENYYT